MGCGEATPRAARTVPGYVYLLRCDVSGVVKIGVTLSAKQRVKGLIGSAPTPRTVLGLATIRPRGLAFRIERNLHSLFADRRVHGEWFRLTAADLDFLGVHLGFAVPKSVADLPR